MIRDSAIASDGHGRENAQQRGVEGLLVNGLAEPLPSTGHLFREGAS